MRSDIPAKQRHLYFAYKSTQTRYDRTPPESDTVPYVAALNARPFVNECYLGIEETLRYLILLGKEQGRDVQKAPKGHDLGRLFCCLSDEDQDAMRRRFRSFWTLYRKAVHEAYPILNENKEEFRELSKSVNKRYEAHMMKFRDLDKFFHVCGNGYGQWRFFIMQSDPDEDSMSRPKVPDMHLDLMLEVWRGLVWLSAIHLRDVEDAGWACIVTEPINVYLDQYIRGHVYRRAERDNAWQRASQHDDEIDFVDLRNWFLNRPSVVRSRTPWLLSGLELLNYTGKKTKSLNGASGLLKQVLVRAANSEVNSHVIADRSSDIILLHGRIIAEGLSWNTTTREFEPMRAC